MRRPASFVKALAFGLGLGLILVSPFAFARPAAAQDEEAYAELIRDGIAKLEATDFEGAIKTFEAAIQVDPDSYTAYYNIACAHSLKGDKERALEWFEKSLVKGMDDRAWIDGDKDLDPIRKEARFKELMDKHLGQGGPGGDGGSGDGGRPSAPLSTLRGEPATIESLRGKVVIVDIWRTWCGPCKRGIPDLVELEREYGPKGLAVVGISDEPAKLQEQFADELKINYTLLIQRGDLPEPFGKVNAFPTTFVLDREGKVVEKFVGVKPKKPFEDAIMPLLEAGPHPQPPAEPEPEPQPL